MFQGRRKLLKYSGRYNIPAGVAVLASECLESFSLVVHIYHGEQPKPNAKHTLNWNSTPLLHLGSFFALSTSTTDWNFGGITETARNHHTIECSISVPGILWWRRIFRWRWQRQPSRHPEFLGSVLRDLHTLELHPSDPGTAGSAKFAPRPGTAGGNCKCWCLGPVAKWQVSCFFWFLNHQTSYNSILILWLYNACEKKTGHRSALNLGSPQRDVLHRPLQGPTVKFDSHCEHCRGLCTTMFDKTAKEVFRFRVENRGSVLHSMLWRKQFCEVSMFACFEFEKDQTTLVQ